MSVIGANFNGWKQLLDETTLSRRYDNFKQFSDKLKKMIGKKHYFLENFEAGWEKKINLSPLCFSMYLLQKQKFPSTLQQKHKDEKNLVQKQY